MSVTKSADMGSIDCPLISNHECARKAPRASRVTPIRTTGSKSRSCTASTRQRRRQVSPQGHRCVVQFVKFTARTNRPGISTSDMDAGRDADMSSLILNSRQTDGSLVILSPISTASSRARIRAASGTSLILRIKQLVPRSDRQDSDYRAPSNGALAGNRDK